MKVLFALLLGLGAGYAVGYKHGSSGKPSVIDGITSKAVGKVKSEVHERTEGPLRDAQDSVKAINKRLQDRAATTTP